MYKKLFAILTLLFTNFATAGVFKEDYHQKQPSTKPYCPPTTSYKIPLSQKPSEYAHYNNITKKEGHFPNKFINKITIKGKVTDTNCVPIPNVRITISQKDEYGVYRFIRSFVPIFEKSYRLNYQQYSTFSGTGTTTSNNRGEFAFITTIPNSRTKDKHRTINISLEHINYPNLSSQIYLGCHIDKHKNNKRFILPKLQNYTETLDRQNLPVYNINLVLNGKSEYKRY